MKDTFKESLKRKSEQLAKSREKAQSEPYYNDARCERMEKFQKQVKNYSRTGMHNKAALGFPVFMNMTNLDYVESEKLRILQLEEDRKPKYKTRTTRAYTYYDTHAKCDLVILTSSRTKADKIIEALTNETGSEFIYDKYSDKKGTNILKWQ